MAVRLEGVCKMISLPCAADYHHLRFDTCRLEYIDSFATILLLQVLIKVRTRAEASNENDTLVDVNLMFLKQFDVKLLL